MTPPPNLHELYASVTEKVPGLAVDGLAWVTDPSGCITLWNRSNEGIDWRRLRHDEAAALIHVTWDEKLPFGYMILKSKTGKCRIVELAADGDMMVVSGELHPTPLEALASFYLSRAKGDE